MTEIATSKTSDCNDTEKTPTTEEIRQRLQENIREGICNERTKTICSPTSSGKSHTAVTTSWRDYPEITGGEPVIYLSPTTDARDSSRAKNAKSDATSQTLLGREDACPVAGGDHDDMDAPDGDVPSEWFYDLCENRGLPPSVVHDKFKRHHDELPCSPCESRTQWEDIPRDSDGKPTHDVVIATHEFARVPDLIKDCNVIIDELSDFTTGKRTEEFRRSVNSYLRDIDAPVKRWEDLISDHLDEQSNRHFARKFKQPDSDWFRDDRDAHILAPGIVQAVLEAEKGSHDRWVGKTVYQYPDLNPHADNQEKRVEIKIVFDKDYNINILQVLPDFSEARSVIGLDAYPTEPKWEENTLNDLSHDRILTEKEEQLWRQNVRNLEIKQVGSNKNTWTKNGYNDEKVSSLLSEIRYHYAEDFRTGITSKKFKSNLLNDMEEIGISEPEVIYHGTEKSVETFADESVGVIAGCISPSHEHIRDWLALRGKEAKLRETEGGYTGQEWVGPDSEVAHEILDDIQMKHVLQAAGRYARDPSNPDDGATVYVLTNVLPDKWIDEYIDGIDLLGQKQQEIVNALYYSVGGITASEISEKVDASQRHVYGTLEQLQDVQWCSVNNTEGKNTGDKHDAVRNPDYVLDVSKNQGVN